MESGGRGSRKHVHGSAPGAGGLGQQADHPKPVKPRRTRLSRHAEPRVTIHPLRPGFASDENQIWRSRDADKTGNQVRTAEQQMPSIVILPADLDDLEFVPAPGWAATASFRIGGGGS